MRVAKRRAGAKRRRPSVVVSYHAPQGPSHVGASLFLQRDRAPCNCRTVIASFGNRWWMTAFLLLFCFILLNCIAFSPFFCRVCSLLFMILGGEKRGATVVCGPCSSICRSLMFLVYLLLWFWCVCDRFVLVPLYK